MALSEALEWILENYVSIRKNGEQFSSQHPIYRRFTEIKDNYESYILNKQVTHILVKFSVGMGNWAKIPWIAFLDERETITTQDGVYPVLLFRGDMTGVYITFNQGVTKLKEKHGTSEARKILNARAQRLREHCSVLKTADFSIDDQIDLRVEKGLGKDYEYSTVAYKLYQKGSIPTDDEIYKDLDLLIEAYEEYMAAKEPLMTPDNNHARIVEPTEVNFDIKQAIQELISYIENRGFVFEPWQIAQYITAIRTKPFVILAGITGTGKSKLPALVAEATGGVSRLIPVQPDWTDSSDVLGYSDLQGDFRPGSVLEVAREAMGNNDQFWTCIIDEMNLARVEQYFAEILSRIEDRRSLSEGGFASSPLLSQYLKEDDAEWRDVVLPPNFAIVGTVNMDESSHGFSRKVLDRAFTIELSHVHLAQWKEKNPGEGSPPTVHAWPVQSWYPRAMKLSDLRNLTKTEQEIIQKAIEALQTINQVLSPAQLQVGYRTRDEIVLFLLHAQEIIEAFVDRTPNTIDPLDLSLQMKILPRIIGGSAAIKRILSGLIGWSIGGVPFQHEEPAREKYRDWDEQGRPQRLPQSQYPFLASRLCLMWERLENEGYTSYWL